MKPKRKRKNRYKNSRGIISFLMLVVIVVLAFLISGVLFENSSTPNPQEGILDYHGTTGSNKSIQETAIHFLTPTPTQPIACGAGKNIVWLNSFSTGEFGSHFTDWVWSQCSQASLVEVLNAYKSPGEKMYTIEELEQHALDIGVWDPFDGFLGPMQVNWTKEAADYGFTVDYRQYDPTPQNLDIVINTANQGHPVIVDAPSHYLVIWGGDSQYVYTLDSSGHDFTWAPQSSSDSINLSGPHEKYKPTRSEFLHGLGGFSNYWGGRAIIITPKNAATSCQ